MSVHPPSGIFKEIIDLDNTITACERRIRNEKIIKFERIPHMLKTMAMLREQRAYYTEAARRILTPQF